MAAISTPTSSPAFVLCRAKIFLAVSLAITWWFASILPHYQPAIKEKFKARLGDALQKIPSIKVDWSAPCDPRDAYNASKVALLIEPRPLPHLVPQILHMISVVPPDWRFLFIGSNESVISVQRAYSTKYQQVIGKLDLMVLPKPWDISSKEHTFRTLTDPRFYNEFLPGVEWILKYESDSILCANSETSLNEWLDWHWVGAPKSWDESFAGNGGLSLRRVSAVQRVLSFQARYNDSEPEDEWFGKRVFLLPGAKVASGLDHALAVDEVPVSNPMGYHVRDGGKNLPPSVWRDPGMRKEILRYCPELSMIMDMKLERERCAGDTRIGTYRPDSTTAEERRKQYAQKLKQQQIEAENRRMAEEAAKKLKMNGAGNKTVEDAVDASPSDNSWAVPPPQTSEPPPFLG